VERESQFFGNGNLMIDDQADYSKIYTGILGQAESRLGTLRAALEEVLSRESALKSAITQLQSDQNKLEQDRNNILQNISSSKGKLGELIQGRSAQEQALESKKIWANSEIIGVSQNLDTINSKNQVLEFELLTLNREVEQIKAIILQTAQQSSKLLITIKQDYLERIRTESQRISTIKQGVEQYLVQRKKST
jgi:chromosome segregation ATPase